MARITVLPAVQHARPYSYSVPDDQDIPPLGGYVEVPLAGRTVMGTVWQDPEMPENFDPAKLKSIGPFFDMVPPMSDAQRTFIERVADYNLAPWGDVLRMSLAGSAGLKAKRAPKHKQAPCAAPRTDSHADSLNPAQAHAARVLCDTVEAQNFEAILLDGVTGAGKTEVYFEAVAKAVALGGQALILLPEIALSNAFLGRFAARFGCPPALWHSGVPESVRKATWLAVARGETKIIMGARSALFLPFADLRLIVVDEEHDQAFKQEDGVRYQARDMAVLRGHVAQHPVVLVSATPSLETVQNVRAKRYSAVHLPDRYGGALLPRMHVIDARQTPPERGQFITPPLRTAIADTMAAGQQTLLFLNRRGYAPLTLCRACGHRMECPNCSAWMVEHRATRRLLCHHCGTHTPLPPQCPKCSAPNSLVPIGPGVERIAEEVQSLYPQARTLILASDQTTEGDTGITKALESIHDGAIDVIIGTQMIAKGHHFPNLTLVGVIDADLGLQGGDLRASERTWQMLHQVSGRAGRGAAAGQVMLQSYMPDNRVIQALAVHDRDAFVDIELEERAAAHMPPFGRLAAIILSDVDAGQVEAAARLLARHAPTAQGLKILGPAQAPIYKLRLQYRWRLLLHADRRFPLQAYMRDWLSHVKLPKRVRVAVDIDPYQFV